MYVVEGQCNADGFAISGVETLQEYTRFLCRQLSLNGHDVLSLQLHGEGFSCSFNVFLL